MIDALSFIIHSEKAYPRARRISEKLKDNIPRQMFEIPIQIAVGGKVIARETVKAMRKDVLAKCLSLIHILPAVRRATLKATERSMLSVNIFLTDLIIRS